MFVSNEDQHEGRDAMSATTIQVPAEHVEAIRQGLLGRRDDSERREEIESLLRQIASGVPAGAGPCELTGSHAVLWSAVYDSLCAAAEQLADDCNEYWRGVVDPESARAGIADVGTRLELLVGLGAPPIG
jgi:hypothetical protein